MGIADVSVPENHMGKFTNSVPVSSYKVFGCKLFMFQELWN